MNLGFERSIDLSTEKKERRGEEQLSVDNQVWYRGEEAKYELTWPKRTRATRFGSSGTENEGRPADRDVGWSKGYVDQGEEEGDTETKKNTAKGQVPEK